MSVLSVNPQILHAVYKYFTNSFLDFSGMPMPSVIALPIIELITKIILAIVALATSVNEFSIFVKNKKFIDVIKPATA